LTAEERVIGCRNRLPWHLPADLRRFRRLTLGKPVIMGRCTYESIGRPLERRHNIVLSRRPPAAGPKGLHWATSVDQALELAATFMTDEDGEAMVIGGEQVYRQLLPLADHLYLTVLKSHYAGDAHFPDYQKNQWEVVDERQMPGDGSVSGAFQELRRSAQAPVPMVARSVPSAP